MQAVRYKVLVFDFDGTLVDTASAKRDAFFAVLPTKCHDAVEAVLRADPDGSRHSVIPSMLEEAGRRGIDVSDLDADTAITAYSNAVNVAVSNASDVAHVENVLDWATGLGTVYVFSMTPECELSRAISLRSWCGFISETFGYPACKKEVLACLLQRHSVHPEEVLVVGDGRSDRDAAVVHGCHFYQVSSSQPLAGVMSFGGA